MSRKPRDGGRRTGHPPLYDEMREYTQAPPSGPGGMDTLCEASVVWPLGAPAFHENEAQRDLEQVGRILARLELDFDEIIQLRTETREILAALAA